MRNLLEFKEVAISGLVTQAGTKLTKFGSESCNVYINSPFRNNNILSPDSHEQVFARKDFSLVFEQNFQYFIFLLGKFNFFIVYYKPFTDSIEVDTVELNNRFIDNFLCI